MTSFMTATYADGPKLVEWLDNDRLLGMSTSVALSSSTCRLLGAWRAGRRARFNAVDHVLTELGLHASEVPEGCWLEDR